MDLEAIGGIVGLIMLVVGMVLVIVCAAAGCVPKSKPKRKEETPEEGQAKYMR